ncbi:MAG: methionine biosynthesis protein MetW [Gammaproteobacteria bacterium]|nr:methionine biosynthesis protein MetW [Gammaproteobacteria bacterium]
MSHTKLRRHDLQMISDWVEADSRVIDLGCGNGRLLQHLQASKGVTGYGVELNPERIAECIDNDVNVIQTNLDKGLGHFDDDSFDYVILSLTLQAMRHPRTLLTEMLRVGQQGIVTFPNFGYWRNRMQVAFSGRMPISAELPEKWYNTPNIHLCTVKDFHSLCAQLNFTVVSTSVVHHSGSQNLGLRLWPNLFGEIALCHIKKNN